MVNGPREVWIERDGRLELTAMRFTDDSHLRRIINKIVAQVGRRIDEASPMVDARLPDGSRVNAIIPPLSLSGPLVTIRKFTQNRLALKDFVRLGTLTAEAIEFLDRCVAAELNILVSGGTGSGKTTLLNAMSTAIPDGDRIVTIEDAAELRLNQRHVLRLESRPANIEGDGAVSIRDLVRNSLRMRPDRIIVGEVRGAEALDMLQAMNTGHDGSLTTLHANTPRDALSRVETMVLMAGFDLPVRAIRQQVASALDLIIHLERLQDGSRRVTAITEVQRMESDVITLQDIYEFKIDGVGASGQVRGHLQPTGLRPTFVHKFEKHGLTLPPTCSPPRRSRSRGRWCSEAGGALPPAWHSRPLGSRPRRTRRAPACRPAAASSRSGSYVLTLPTNAAWTCDGRRSPRTVSPSSASASSRHQPLRRAAGHRCQHQHARGADPRARWQPPGPSRPSGPPRSRSGS